MLKIQMDLKKKVLKEKMMVNKKCLLNGVFNSLKKNTIKWELIITKYSKTYEVF